MHHFITKGYSAVNGQTAAPKRIVSYTDKSEKNLMVVLKESDSVVKNMLQVIVDSVTTERAVNNKLTRGQGH